MVRDLFRDKEATEFIIATIPTVLGVAESGRLLQSLRKEEIPCKRIIVNQVGPHDLRRRVAAEGYGRGFTPQLTAALLHPSILQHCWVHLSHKRGIYLYTLPRHPASAWKVKLQPPARATAFQLHLARAQSSPGGVHSLLSGDDTHTSAACLHRSTRVPATWPCSTSVSVCHVPHTSSCTRREYGGVHGLPVMSDQRWPVCLSDTHHFLGFCL